MERMSAGVAGRISMASAFEAIEDAGPSSR
jgi:hypothetical protein